MSNQARPTTPQQQQPASMPMQQPNVGNLVRGVGQVQQGIQGNLGGQQGAPDITQLIRQVGQNRAMQQSIMGNSMPASQPLGQQGMNSNSK